MALELTSEQRTVLPRNSKIVVAMWEAKDRGDTEEYYRLLSELDIPAHTLMAIKRAKAGGADWIRKRNLRTRLSDKKYGPDWLDLTEEEEFARQRTAGGR